jgi:hypothetical protein
MLHLIADSPFISPDQARLDACRQDCIACDGNAERCQAGVGPQCTACNEGRYSDCQTEECFSRLNGCLGWTDAGEVAYPIWSAAA